MLTLVEQLDRGFLMGERWFPWGSLFAELLSLYPDPERADPRWLDRACSALGEVATVDASVHGPAPQRPVVAATYGLPAELARDSGLAALRAQLDHSLAPGVHEAVAGLGGFPASGRVRAASEWRAGDTRVCLSAYARPREQRFGQVGGRLYLYRDEFELAEPYLAAFRAQGQAWAQSPGALESWPTGDRDGEGFLDEEGERDLALRCPHLRRSPAWIAAALGDSEVALWAHPSGVWGVADRIATIVLSAGEPLALRHERWLRGRGPGYAALYWVDHGLVVSSSPGPAGLDALVEELRQRSGVEVEACEMVDA